MTTEPLPKPTLCSLPREILSAVVAALDRPSAVALARAASSLAPVADQGIWRDPNLSAFAHCAGTHSGAPQRYVGTNGISSNTEDPEESRRERGLAVKAKVQEIICRADQRRWWLVQRVTFCPVEEAVEPTLQLLRSVKDNLKTLEIDTRCHHNGDQALPPRYLESFDVGFLHSGIHFPSLTRVRLSALSATFIEIIPLLCNASSNLLSFVADVDQGFPPPCVDPLIPPFPSFQCNTKIREIRIAFTEWEDDGFEQYVQQMEYEPHDVVLSLLEHSPELRQLSLGSPVPYLLRRRLVMIIEKCEHLEDLWWPRDDRNPEYDRLYNSRPIPEPAWVQEIGESLSLKRLLSKSSNLEKVFADLPALPNLEMLYFQPRLGCRGSTCIARTDKINFTLPVQGMRPSFAALLRDHPNLRAICSMSMPHADLDEDANVFDELDGCEAAGSRRQFVRSFKHHSGGELLHARLYMDTYSTFPGQLTSGYLHFTDYEGIMVPLRLIRKMEAAEGIADKRWRGRGVEVGDEAWKVLLEWKKDMDDAQGAE